MFAHFCRPKFAAAAKNDIHQLKSRKTAAWEKREL
jgi:hypothetical protein